MVEWECLTNPREASGLDPEAIHCSDHAYDEEFVEFEGTPNYDEVRAHATYNVRRPTGEAHPHVRGINVQVRSPPSDGEM
jgi:hypothetical protein